MMKHLHSTGSGFVWKLLIILVSILTSATAATRPNIIFFLVDDMGWQDTSVPFAAERTPFNDYYRTPSMERLAANGVRFTQAYSCAVCTPTRVSWMTGQNETTHHVTNWTLKGETSHQSPQLLPPPWKMQGLQPDDGPTAAGLLRAAGYRTIHVGKAHWGAIGTKGADPLNLGFDVNIAGHAAGAPASYQGLDRYGEGKPGQKDWAVPGLEEYKGKDIHLTEALTTEACREIEKSVKQLHQPFFLYLAHYAVHMPLQAQRPYIEHYKDQKVAESEKQYASMVEGMDASLGKVMDKLNELGVAQDTLIVFYSDNGGETHTLRGVTVMGTGKNTHNLPLREGKGSAYEGGIRVPAIVSWAKPDPADPLQKSIPIATNARCSRPIVVEDLFPTFLKWANAPLPKSPIDGHDITPLLDHPQETQRPTPLFWHFPNVWTSFPKDVHVGYQPHSIIRSGDWKAIYFYENQTWELYNIAKDFEEKTDLASKEPARLAELAKQLFQRLETTHSPWPVDKATHQPRVMKLPTKP